MNAQAKVKAAFTLIELLVVIAIIAILAAILFPVFAQAKAAAKTSAAISNIKQNVLGGVMYANDYDDTCYLSWQDGNWDDPVGGGYSVQKLYPYTKNIDIAWDPAGGIPNIAGGRPMPSTGYWGDWTTDQTLSWNNNGLMYGSDPLTGLPMPRTYSGVDRSSELMQLISVIDPNGWFAFDGTQGSCHTTGGKTGYDEEIPSDWTGNYPGIWAAATKWHSNGICTGFMDGHAKSVKGMQFQATDCDNQTYQWWAGKSSKGDYTANNAWSTFYLSDKPLHYWGSWWSASE